MWVKGAGQGVSVMVGLIGLGSSPQCGLLAARSPRLFCYQQASRLLPADRCIRDAHPGYHKSGARTMLMVEQGAGRERA